MTDRWHHPASGPREALTRIENLLEMSGVNLPTKAARAQIASALDMIVQVSRMSDGKRRVTAIVEVIGMGATSSPPRSSSPTTHKFRRNYG